MLTEKEFYDQGSKCCQQYSALTMQVRTMAQHVLIGYAVAMGLVLSRVPELSASSVRILIACAGLIVMIFGLVLWVLNYHHSTAFRAIRDEVLVRLEEKVEGGPMGPWTAHKRERATRRLGPFLASDLAWHGPFIALEVVGLATIVTAFLV